MNGLGIRSGPAAPARPAASPEHVYARQSRDKRDPVVELYRWTAFLELWHMRNNVDARSFSRRV